MTKVRRDPAVRMPAFLQHPLTVGMIMVLLLLPFFVKIPTAFRRHPVIAPLGDQFHVVLLAGVTLMLYWRGPLTGRLGAAALSAAVIGGSIEFLQLLVGRAALFHDFLLDLIGIGLVAGYVLWKGHDRVAGRWLVALMLLCALSQVSHVPGVIAAAARARDLFPVIADFEKGRDRWIWDHTNDGEVTFPQVPDTPDGPGRALRLTGAPPDNWPGASMRRFPHDWSAFEVLELDVRVTEAEHDTIPFSVRLEDYAAARANLFTYRGFAATRRWRTITMPLAGLRLNDDSRDLDLGDVDHLIIYFARPDAGVTIEIDNIRLE